MPTKKKKVKTKLKAKAKAKGKRPSERREFRRYATPRLWVTERSGDYQFVLPAGNLSEGGVFLTGRMKTTGSPSQLVLHLGKTVGSMEVVAQPVHDRLARSSYGTGYRFISLSVSQTRLLRSYLRNLD